MNSRRRAYPNDRLVMRPSEKFEAKAAGQKGSEAWSSHVENVFGRQRWHRTLQPDVIERVIWIRSIMQNKANLGNDKMNTNLDMTSIYKILSTGSGQKTKPIQTQFKANLSQNKPNLTQFKANSKPTCSERVEPMAKRAKMNSFAWIRSCAMVFVISSRNLPPLRVPTNLPMIYGGSK